MINSTLDDQSTPPSRDKFFEDLFEVLRDLLERPLDRFILSLVENLDKLLDGLSGLLQFYTSLLELVALLREVVVLLERFLVDMSELLKALVNGVQLLHELLTRDVSMLNDE